MSPGEPREGHHEPGRQEHGHPRRGPQGHGHEEHPQHLPPVQRRTLTLITALALAAMIVLFLVGFLIRHARVKHREDIARHIRDQPPVVQLIEPKPSEQSVELNLPADVHAYAVTALYARTNGYLASWKFDINDRVKKGQVMAIISAPDTDAELEQARAALNQQATNHRLANLTDERFRGLIPVQGVTQQQLDQNRAALQQAAAGVSSAQADVDRLKALVGFEQIIAPYDGVVTVRTYDVGALITAAQTGAGQELFDVAEDDRLRVYVNVPQPYVEAIHFGDPVQLSLERNFPGHRFNGIIARAAGSLDLATRTLRTELDFPNTDPAFHIYPGMYAEALFHVRRAKPVLTIPTSALLFEAEGKEVAVVTADNKIHLQKIVPGNDYGTYMEVLSGLNERDRIVENPGEELVEGLVVSPAPQNGGRNP